MLMLAIRATKSDENAYAVGMLLGSCWMMLALAAITLVTWTQQTHLMVELVNHRMFIERCHVVGSSFKSASNGCLFYTLNDGTFFPATQAQPANCRISFPNPSLNFDTITACCCGLTAVEARRYCSCSCSSGTRSCATAALAQNAWVSRKVVAGALTGALMSGDANSQEGGGS